jgi:hypothetical protein
MGRKKNAEPTRWFLNCIECGKILYHKSKSSLNRAHRGSKKCISCSHSGQVVWNAGLDKSDPRVKNNCRNAFGKDGNFSTLNKGKTYEEIYGVEKSLEIKKKREKYWISGGWGNYNPNSIPILEEYAKNNGYNIKHAENGGEFTVYIDNGIVYHVDAYDHEKNVVIEYYEKFHKKQKCYDEKRKKEIIEKLGCKFIEIKEWEL